MVIEKEQTDANANGNAEPRVPIEGMIEAINLSRWRNKIGDQTDLLAHLTIDDIVRAIPESHRSAFNQTERDAGPRVSVSLRDLDNLTQKLNRFAKNSKELRRLIEVAYQNQTGKSPKDLA